MIGTRIHGVMLALQAGVPALCIAHDSRTLELCKVMHVPYVLWKEVIDGVQREDLIRMLNFDPDAFDKNRLNLSLAYSDFLMRNNIENYRVLNVK